MRLRYLECLDSYGSFCQARQLHVPGTSSDGNVKIRTDPKLLKSEKSNDKTIDIKNTS